MCTVRNAAASQPSVVSLGRALLRRCASIRGFQPLRVQVSVGA